MEEVNADCNILSYPLDACLCLLSCSKKMIFLERLLLKRNIPSKS